MPLDVYQHHMFLMGLFARNFNVKDVLLDVRGHKHVILKIFIRSAT